MNPTRTASNARDEPGGFLHAPGSKMPEAALRLSIVAALGATLSCSAPAPPPRGPQVTQIEVPVHAVVASDERTVANFHCDEPAIGETTRVEFRVQSAARDGSNAIQTRAVYTITTQTERDHRIARAAIVLESLTTDAPDRAQSAWTLGLDAGWISLRRPFEIARDGASWCFVNACDDAARQEFAGAIGDTAELVALPELTEQLTRTDDTGAITLPPVLMKRMGVGVIDASELSPKAYRHGSDFPARYVVERARPAGSEASDEATADATEPLARAELLVSRSCRLESLRVELARTDLTPETGGNTHRFSWSFDPLP